MSDDEEQGSNISVSVPIGALAGAALLGAAAVAYAMLNRGDDSGESSSGGTRRGKGMRRRIGLMTVITLLENDASRKVVLAVLRAMARRS
ncbi:MAG TPA: hypothetical protein VF221_16545 [Chloroflexota bacterium]